MFDSSRGYTVDASRPGQIELRSGLDKILRILVGIALIAWALMGGPVWAWIGIVPLLTGAMGWCPAYTLLGMNTCPLKKK